MHLNTRIARLDRATEGTIRPTSTPIYQTATFEQESALEFGRFDYSRSGNPTRESLESRVAELEQGRFGFAFSSGMAAITTMLRAAFCLDGRPVGSGRLVLGSDLYGGTSRLVEKLFAPLGIEICRVDTTDLEAVEIALSKPSSGPLWILFETPSNPLLRITDIAGVAQLARAAGARLAVDNTALSPYLQNPLELGADVVVHSATKHLGGHGDTTAGVIVTRDEDLAESVGFLQNAEGNALSPFDSWLVLRGLKTLAVRVAQETRSAGEIARFLTTVPVVHRVHYPGLAEHVGHEQHTRQSRGGGGLISFETGDAEFSKRICEGTQLFRIAVSFGSTNSTISLPCHMSHASVPRTAIQSGRIAPLPKDLVRLSVGLEDSRDLIADLSQVLNLGDPGTSDARSQRRAVSIPSAPG